MGGEGLRLAGLSFYLVALLVSDLRLYPGRELLVIALEILEARTKRMIALCTA